MGIGECGYYLEQEREREECAAALVSAPWSATLMVSGENKEKALEMLQGLIAAISFSGAMGTIHLAGEGADGRVVVTTSDQRV